MSFLGRCNVEVVSPPGFQGLSCSKVEGFEGGLFQKLFKGYIFCFLGHLVGRYIFELPTRETNLMKKRSVSMLEKKGLQIKRNWSKPSHLDHSTMFCTVQAHTQIIRFLSLDFVQKMGIFCFNLKTFLLKHFFFEQTLYDLHRHNYKAGPKSKK